MSSSRTTSDALEDEGVRRDDHHSNDDDDDASMPPAPATSKRLQRRLLKQQRRAQLKAEGGGRQRKRRSQRDCNRGGELLKRSNTGAGVQSSTPATIATYAPCASRSCGDGDGCRLRTVAPYVHRFETFAKARWSGRTLADVFVHDFAGLPPDYCEAAIARGLIRVNGERKAPEYVVCDGDFLEHVVHRHEPPVHFPPPSRPTCGAAAAAPNSAELVHFDGDDVVVVNKPSSIPVHPSGAYLHNSITRLLQSEHGMPELFPVHRLDRLTSGLLLLAKSPAKARELCEDIASGLVQKHYVARVLGEFPRVGSSHAFDAVRAEDAAAGVEISRKELGGEAYWSLSAPIGCVSSADHLQGVTRDGKRAETLLRTRSFDGTHSVVECLPITGRTHQIRVHLQFLGFPIANDPQYAPGDTQSERRGEADDIIAAKDVVDCSSSSKSEATTPHDEALDDDNDDAARCASVCSACRDGERAIFSSVQRECFAMWLHSFRYTSAKWAFEVPLPRWAASQ